MSSSGSATITSPTDGCVANARTLRDKIGSPPTSISCFGWVPPKRRPRPPAAMMAVTNIAGLPDGRSAPCSLHFLQFRNPAILQCLDGPRNVPVDGIGKRLRIVDRRRVEPRRKDWIMNDEPHIGRL